MPQAVVAVIGFVVDGLIFAQGIGTAIGLGTGILAAVGGVAIIAGVGLVAAKAMSLFEIDLPKVDTDASRQQTVKSTIEPQKVIYGEALVSGPVSYVGVAGTNNEDLYQVITLAGHEVNAITDIHFDNIIISNTAINSGNANGGAVGSGIFSGYATINKHLGLATETADSLLVNAFANYTSAHRGDGLAYLAMKWTFNEDSAETWNKFAPNNVKALVQGKKIYDPRLDVAAGNAAGANPTNASYIQYQTNPVNCLIDYLMDTNYGMGIAADKINWTAAITAANGCDVSVNVPDGTESRFTCNGVIFATDSHKKNIAKILSSMNGTLVYSNGKYVIRAGIYETPTETLTEDDLIGAIAVKTSFERSERVNTIKGLFIDPAQNHKSSEFPTVQLADAVTRDNGEVLEKEIALNMTNTSYMAQRISNKIIQLTDQQKVVNFPANLSAMRITVGDRVQVSIEELSWSNKVFQCVGWTFSDEGGVNLTLREDSSTSYADPAVNAYSTISATGTLSDGFRGVPSPSGLSVTAGLKNNELNWVNPPNPSDFRTIFVYASPNGNFSSAVKIGETDGTQFIHDASNSADSVSAGDVRYYWVRAVRFKGTSDEAQSNLEPNADPNTTVFATVGRVNWADVSGSTNAPADNATVGAQISVNLYDTDGSTVMNQADVKNSVLAQEILQVEVESGEVLDLETGQDVDIQNLGDVAIFVSDSNQTLNSSINTVAQNLSSLEDTVVDLTSGVSDIYIQATAPVAGVGGIPNPIPTFSRWYDSDDNNHPYYWTGSAWVSLKDAQISQNATAITNLQTSLATTNGNVTSNASAISVLDATTVSQGNSITSITSDVTALETTVNNASTGVAANASGLSNLTTRVTTAEGAITTNASDITTLTTNVTTANTNITTNSTAISGLDTRVTTAEGTITTQSSDITALESTVNNGTTGVAANASGLSALTTRVSTAEGAITTNSSAVTTLDATYTEDLHFRTEVEDENDDLIDLETSGTVQLQDLSDFVSGSSSAIDSLTVQTYVNEDNIQTQAIQLTALESTVNDPTNGVVATAGALSNLTTEVSVIDGVVTSTAQDLTTLTTTVGGNTASITTQANSINGVEANYSVKIDNNNRITGFGLLSTTAGATPFSEFAVVADQFSIVSPDSTADTPIQPFTVTSDKIYFGADVVVSGDLISTGTISADRLQIDGVMFDTETVGGVTSLIIKESGVNTSQIAESAITTARLSNDAVTVEKFANTLQSTNYVADTSGWQILTSGDVEFQNAKVTGEINATSGTLSSSIAIGTGNSIFKADSNGIYLGNATFASAPFRVTPSGDVTATSVNITGTVDASTNFTFNGTNVTGTMNVANLDVAGIITTGALITDSATIANDIRIGSGESVFSADSNGIYLGNETFANAEFRVTPAGVLTATGATITGAITATSGSIANSVTVGGTAASTVATGAQVGSTGGFVSVVKPSFGHFDGLTTTDIFTQSLQGTTATRSFDTTIFRVGTQAIKQNGATGGVGFYSPVGSLDLIPSRKYMMTFWVRATTTDGVWSVGIHDGSSLYGAVGTALTAANTWEFKAAIVDLSASTSSTGYYRIFNNNFTSGSAYFDAISIFDITDATSVTTTNVSQTYFSPLAQAVAVDTDKVNGTAASTISAGAIAGASAIQDNDTGLTLGLQAGSAGPVTISYTAASGSDPEVAKLYQGTGTFNNSNTGFYLDNSGNFSLQDKLAFNGSTLAVSGTVNASAGAFTGDVSTDSKFVAGSGATSATMDGADANYKFYAGAASAGDSPFKVDTSGTVTADRIIITRPDDPSAIIFDSAQDGLVGIGLSSISSESDNAVAEIGYELTSNTDNVRLISSSNSNTTLRVLFPLGYAPFSITSEEDFPDSITLKFQIATVTGGVVGTFSDISNGSKTFTRRVYSSAAPSDDDYYSVYSSGTAWYVKGKDAVDGQFNLSFSKTFVTNNIDAAYRVQVSFVAGSGSGSGNPNTSASRTIYFTNDTQYFTIDSNDIIRDQAAGSTVTGDVILSGSSGTRSIIWRDSDDLDENWAIEAYVDSSESNSNTMFFKYNNATSTPFSFVGDTGNLLILGDFYSGLGAVTTATASFGGGYGNTGISIDNAGNYQGNGNITIDGTLSQGSDIRLKSNVETIDGSKVFDMRGVSFVKNGEKGTGVIAQELQEIAPELVKEGSDGMLSVAYGDLIGYLIESVKTLKDEIDQIKADQS